MYPLCSHLEVSWCSRDRALAYRMSPRYHSLLYSCASTRSPSKMLKENYSNLYVFYTNVHRYNLNVHVTQQLELRPSQKKEVVVQFDPTYCRDRQSRTEDNQLVVAYKEHPLRVR